MRYERIGRGFNSCSEVHLGIAQPVQSARLGSERPEVKILLPRPVYGSSTTGSARGSEPRGCWIVPSLPCHYDDVAE